MLQEKVRSLLRRVIKEVNQQLPQEKQLGTSSDTIFLGESGNLDSLGLVSLVVAIEMEIDEEFGFMLTISEDEIIFQKTGPFYSFETLARYICSIVEKESSNG